MQSSLAKLWQLPPTWLRFLIVVLLVLGIFFRFVNIDKKFYWRDEALTLLTISGYTQTEAVQHLYNGNVIGVPDLQKYQQLNPEKSTVDVIKVLAEETPEHPPLYYVASRWWVQLFGTSVAATRTLSALMSLLAFPCIYWLCLELFESPLVAWIAVAIIAISPFQVLYAQEAREYSLWAVTTLLSSAALLRAMRLNTKMSWAIYAATLALALYSYLFSAFVAVAHAFYVVVTQSWRSRKTFINYLLAASAGGLAFAPWLLTVVTHLSQLHKSMDWINYKLSFPALLTRWVFNLCRVFMDWNYGWSFRTPVPYLAIIAILAMVAYAIYYLCRHAPKRAWLFILVLIGVTALALVLPDLLLGGQRSRVSRYLIPFYLGVQIAVAYLLASKISTVTIHIWRQRLWQLLTIALLSTGVLSCAISSPAEDWWNKVGTSPKLVRGINKAAQPLLISDTPLPTDVIALTYIVNEKVKFLLPSDANSIKIPEGFTDVFVFKPSDTLKAELKQAQNYRIKTLSAEPEK